MGTILSIALPKIQSEFNTTLSVIQWVFNSSALMLAALILISGSLGDRYGRKRVFVIGIVVFIVGALLSAFAHSVVQLILFQAVQGVGAALLLPGSLAIINYCFVEEHRGQAIGLWAGFSGGLAATGPFVGGWLVELFGWRSIFYFIVPIGIIAFFIATAFVPENKNPKALPTDWVGAFLAAIVLFGFTISLIWGPTLGWGNKLVIASFIGGILALILFIFFERRSTHPLIPLQIFNDPLVVGANAVTFVLYFALSGTIFFLVLNLQQIQGFSPSATGLALLPPILLITFLSGPAGKLSDKIGPRLPMIVGPFIVAVGMALMALAPTYINYYVHFLPGLILFGAGMALVIAPLTKSALGTHQELSGITSGFNNTVSRVAGLLAVAILGVFMITMFSNSIERGVTKLSMAEEEKQFVISQKYKLGAIVLENGFDENSREAIENEIAKSFTGGFRLIMWINALLAFLGAIIAVFTICAKRSVTTKHPLK